MIEPNVLAYLHILHFTAIKRTENEQIVNEENHSSDEYCQEDNIDYDNMVNRMMENKSFRGRKRKANTSTKRTKRFKKGKTLK